MVNVVSFQDFGGGGGAHGEAYCWLCQKPTSLRALFCHHCGTIQPVRELDFFTRLGLEKRVDIDLDLLERQYATLRRTLDPNRFAIRGLGERGHAARQLEAIDLAYETLRDPLRRSRYWLSLHQTEFEEAEASNPIVAELRRDLEGAGETALCDRVAQKAGQALEEGVVSLMQSLRGQNWQLANAMLIELDGLETVLNSARDRRSLLATTERDANDPPPGAD